MNRECMSDWTSLKKREQLDEDVGMEILIRGLAERESTHKRRNRESKLTMGELLDESSHSRKMKSLAKKRDEVLPPRKDLTLTEKMSDSSQRETNADSSSNSGTSSREEPRNLAVSQAFKGRGHALKWKERDTKKFFKALSLFGTDFSMVALLFKGRDRSQLINKYHKEERDNPNRIEAALQAHKRGGSTILRRCENLLNRPQIPETMSRKVSTSSMDSLDQMIYEELDTQISSLPRPCPSCPPGSSGLPI